MRHFVCLPFYFRRAPAEQTKTENKKKYFGEMSTPKMDEIASFQEYSCLRN